MKLTISLKIKLLLSLLLYSPHILPMNNKIKLIVTIIVGGTVTHHYYKKKQSFNTYYAEKDLIYLPTVEKLEPLKSISLNSSLDKIDHTTTYNHLVAQHQA